MFKALLAPLLAVSLIIPSPDQLFPWRLFGPTVIEQTSSATVRITGKRKVETFLGTIDAGIVCSGFVIAPQQVLTANHCVSDSMKADGKKAKVLRTDEYYDLALLQVNNLNKQPLIIGDLAPSVGDKLTAAGYAGGFTKLITLTVEVKITDYAPEEWPGFAPSIWVMPTFVGGMSGGPVVDSSGFVVSVVQAGTPDGAFGIGVGIEMIKAFLVGS
jgi:S1-C subfamily serine protease